jgi:beta-lactamase regulating signal transducer with metallopeptidase domain
MNLLLESALKASVLVVIGLLPLLLLRSRSASLRHWILAVAMMAALATPLLIVVAPSWNLPLPAANERGVPPPSRATTSNQAPRGRVETAIVGVTTDQATPRAIDPIPIVLTVWLAGVMVNLAGLLVGLWRLQRIASRATTVNEGPWADAVRSLMNDDGLRGTVRLLKSDAPALLVTWGVLAPKVMLPRDADGWSADRIHVVVAHELAHIRRSDWIIQIAGELLRIVYWFNPLMWFASARLRLESERACDDAVVNLGVQGGDYAVHLLELARQFGRASRVSFPAAAITPRPSSLHRRVSAMLNPRLSRRPLSATTRFGTSAALLAIALPIALLAQNRFSTLSGSVMDPSGGLLPGVTVAAVDTTRGARHEVKTNSAGQFEIIGLAEGPHVLQVSLPGFQTFEQKLALDGQDMNHSIMMRVGTLQETISVTRGGAPPSFEGQRFSPKPATCGASGGQGGAGTTPLRIGGQIRQPTKIRHVSPIYPEGSSPGVVRMATTINANGFVQDTKVINAAPAALAQAAMDAVVQWEFTPTLLNCVAVPVIMTVTVDFN